MTVRALERDSGEPQAAEQRPQTPPAPSRPMVDEQHPWPGLAAYDEAAQPFFHGRSREALELLRLVRLAPLSVVYSQSGLGKSSLLQAGLFPLLRKAHFLPVYLRLSFADDGTASPLEQVQQRLEEELNRVVADYPPCLPGQSLWEYLHRKDLEIWSGDNFPLVPVLVFDQFEELFSRSGGKLGLIDRFFDDLADLIENRIPAPLSADPVAAQGADASAVPESSARRRSRLDLFSQNYRLILAFREDFLPELKAREKKAPSLLSSYLRLEPMSREQAIEAVELAGAALLDKTEPKDRAVSTRIVDFVGNQDSAATAAASAQVIEPVLLSLCCAQLNRRRAAGTKITTTLVDAAGQDILDEFYRQALADVQAVGAPDVEQFIEDELIQGDHFRGDYPRKEALDKNLINRAQLKLLTDRHRLLRVAQHSDTQRIELIHDRLVPVVRKARDARKLARKQADLAREAEQQRQRADEERRRANEQARALLWTRFILALAVLAALGAVFYWSRAERQESKADRQAQLASARALVAAALYQSEVDPELGTLLALRAVERAKELGDVPQHEAGDALARNTDALRLRSTISVGRGILRADYSPSASRLAFTLDDGTLRSLAWPGGEDRGEFEDGDARFFAPRFSPDGLRLAAAAEDGLRVWNVGTRAVEWRTTLPGNADVVCFSADGAWLAVGGAFTTRLYQVGADEPQLTLQAGHVDEAGVEWPVGALALAPGAASGGVPGAPSLLATGAGDDKVRLWDARTGQALKTLSGHTGIVSSLEFSADGQFLLSASEDGTARIWEVSSGRLQTTLSGHTNSVFRAAYSLDGSKVVTASADASVRVWDPASGREALRLVSHSQPVTFAQFVDADRQIVSASWDGSVKSWAASGHAGKIESVVFSADGGEFATAGQDQSIRLWDTPSGSELRVLRGHTQAVSALTFAPLDRWLASGDRSGQVILWEPATGRQGQRLERQRRRIEGLAFSPDGTRLVAVAGTAGMTLWPLDAPQAEPLHWTDTNVTRVAFSPNSEWVAASGDYYTVYLGRTRAPSERRDIDAQQGQIFVTEFSPDSTLLATAGVDGRARLWDVGSGERRGTDLEHDSAVMAGRFMPDGTRLITSTLKGSIYVWDWKTGQRLPGPVAPHSAHVYLDLSGDGRRLASFSWDHRVKVWDTTSWQPLAAHTHREQVTGGGITPNGAYVASLTFSDGVRILPLDLAELTQRARRLVRRELTPDECTRYLGQDCSSVTP